MPDAVFPSRRDEAAAPAGSALFFRRRGAAPSEDVLAPHEGRTGAPRDQIATPPAPAAQAVISWIFLVSSGSTGPLCMAMALVMSPCSLILPAMNACMAACGLASTIIALAVS